MLPESPQFDRRPVQVLLIHGTGAAAISDYGEQWWQIGSQFHSSLSQKLGSAANVQPEGAVFHWPGGNSERQRRKAAKRLAGIIREYEEAQTLYAIVGHSHGGSVGWQALIKATPPGSSLRYLKAFVTIGTPYLHPRLDRMLLWYIAPFVATVLVALSAYRYAREPIREFLTGFHWGDPAMAAAALCALLTLIVFLYCIRYVIVLPRLAFEKREAAHRRHVFKAISPVMLCLASPEDEAINGLTQTLRFGGNVLPRTPWFYGPVNIFAARGDEFIWTNLARKAQGCDLPWLEISDVSSTPFPEANSATLPAGVNERINSAADEATQHLLIKLRQALAMSSAQKLMLTNLGETVVEFVTMKEVVHCQYFQDECLVDEIAGFLKRPAPPEALAAPSKLPAVPVPCLPRRSNPVWSATVLSVTVLLAGLLFYGITEPLTDRPQAASALNAAPFLRAAASIQGVLNWVQQNPLDEFLGAVVQFGVADRALQFAESIENAGPRILTLVKLAHLERSLGKSNAAALDRAVEAWDVWERRGFEGLPVTRSGTKVGLGDVWTALLTELFTAAEKDPSRKTALTRIAQNQAAREDMRTLQMAASGATDTVLAHEISGNPMAILDFPPETAQRIVTLPELPKSLRSMLRGLLCEDAAKHRFYVFAASICQGGTSAVNAPFSVETDRIEAMWQAHVSEMEKQARAELETVTAQVRALDNQPTIPDYRSSIRYCTLANLGLDMGAAVPVLTELMNSHGGTTLDRHCAAAWLKLGEVQQAAILLLQADRTELGKISQPGFVPDVDSLAESAIQRKLDRRLWSAIDQARPNTKASLAVALAKASHGKMYIAEAQAAIGRIPAEVAWSNFLGRLGVALVEDRPVREALRLTEPCLPEDRLLVIAAALRKTTRPGTMPGSW